MLERLKEECSTILKKVRVDNGSEFIFKELGELAYENQVILDLSCPGKPTDNAYIESFNGSFRDECLNYQLVFINGDVIEKIEAWRTEYI